MMRRLGLAIALAMMGGAAIAASPEDDYIAARDKAIADMAALENSNTAIEAIDAANEKALADLGKRLNDIVAPFKVADFPAAGTINLESLSDADIGYGMLDGIRHGGEDAGPSIVASTRGLLQRWLQSKTGEEDPYFKLPADIAAALKLDTFYTQAIGSDAAFSGTMDLALKTPAGADIAVARLGGWTQDVGPIYDQRIVLTLVKGDSVLLAEVPATPAVPKIPACETVWTTESAAAEKLADQSSGDDESSDSSDAANSAWEKADSDYRACMAENLPKDPAFPALVAQAQTLADHMAAN